MGLIAEIKELFHRKVDATGLALFRMTYGIIMFFEFAQLWRYKSVMYDQIPFVYTGEINVSYILGFWVVIMILFFIGCCTRWMTILNFIFGVIIFSSARHFEYHVFYAYLGVNFILLFLPVGRVWSVDSLWKKIKYSEIGRPYQPDSKVLEINYLVMVFVSIALMYFDSVFQKAVSQMWINGLGVWMPSSLPMYAWNDVSFLLNSKYLMLILGYTVLAFETLFIWLMWYRKLRIPLMVFGALFHIGILICFPIPLFAITYVAVYFLMLPAEFWPRLLNKFRINKTLFTFYYDIECPLCNKVVAAIKAIDFFKTVQCVPVQGNYQNEPALNGINEEDLLISIYGVTKDKKVTSGYFTYVQLFKSLIYTYPLGLLLSLPGITSLGKMIYEKIAGDRLTQRCTSENCSMPHYAELPDENKDVLVKGWNQLAITQKWWRILLTYLFIQQCIIIMGVDPVRSQLEKIPVLGRLTQIAYSVTAKPASTLMGVTTHGVFIDYHFENYNHLIKVNYVDANGKEHLVPILNENGQPDTYDVAILWRNISFNVLTSNVRQDKIEKGIPPYLNLYLSENGLPLHKGKFKFYVKEIEVPKQWEHDFLRRQFAKPWKEAGFCELNKNGAQFQWNSHMQDVLESERKIQAQKK